MWGLGAVSQQLTGASFVCLLLRGGFSHRGRLRLVPPREEEARPVHEGATEGTRTRVRRQQIYHQGQKEEDICPDQPVRATGHDMVPKQTRKREESCQQIEDHQLVLTTSVGDKLILPTHILTRLDP